MSDLGETDYYQELNDECSSENSNAIEEEKNSGSKEEPVESKYEIQDSKEEYKTIVSNKQSDLESEAEKELEELKARIKQIKEEAEKLKAMSTESDQKVKQEAEMIKKYATENERKEADSKSVFVGNIDFKAKVSDLEEHFQGMGTVVRVTIVTNKYSGKSKGFAYIEFESAESVDAALAMNETLFFGRQLQVIKKRTNQHSFYNNARGRGTFRGGYRPRRRYNPYSGARGLCPRGGYRGRARHRGASYRNRY